MTDCRVTHHRHGVGRHERRRAEDGQVRHVNEHVDDGDEGEAHPDGAREVPVGEEKGEGVTRAMGIAKAY